MSSFACKVAFELVGEDDNGFVRRIPIALSQSVLKTRRFYRYSWISVSSKQKTITEIVYDFYVFCNCPRSVEIIQGLKPNSVCSILLLFSGVELLSYQHLNNFSRINSSTTAPVSTSRSTRDLLSNSFFHLGQHQFYWQVHSFNEETGPNNTDRSFFVAFTPTIATRATGNATLY